MAVEVSLVNTNVKLVVIRRRRVSPVMKGKLLFHALKVRFLVFTYCLFI